MSRRSSLTGTAGLQVDGSRLTAVQQWQRAGSGVRVGAVRKRLVVQMEERTVGLTRLVARPVEHRAADELVLDGARTQTSALRLDLTQDANALVHQNFISR